MKQDFEAIKKLEFTREDIEKFASFFHLIHHSPGRIRLRVSEKLKNMLLSDDAQKILNFFDEIKALPMIKGIKLNKVIGSVTIEYDSKVFAPNLWEVWLSGENSACVYEHIQDIIKAL